MNEVTRVSWPARLGLGITAGALIATVDNLLFEGEVSPIVILGLLLVTTITAGAVFGGRAWMISIVTWFCIPAAHLVKKVLDLPDTLHPNTYVSILMLAGFTLGVAAMGTLAGMIVRWLATSSPLPAAPRAGADGGE